VHPPTTTRRAFLRRAGSTVLLVSGASAVVAGCSDDDGSPRGGHSASAAATDDSSDEAAAARALRDTTRLAATYDAVMAKHRDLRPTLRPLRADLEEHMDVLSGALGDSGTQRGRAASVPRSATAAQQQLAADEAVAVRRRRRDAIQVESGDLARLLGSIAACHAQHRTLLGRGGKHKQPAAPDPASIRINSKPVVDAMNETLAGEHAAIYAYGVIGGRLDIDSTPVAEAADAIDVHQARRDALTALVESAGETPVAAEPGYLLPSDVVNVATARKTAQTVEDRCGVLYATLAATATDEIRAYAVDALIDSATRALEWDAPGSALPGLSDAKS